MILKTDFVLLPPFLPLSHSLVSRGFDLFPYEIEGYTKLELFPMRYEMEQLRHALVICLD